MVAAYGALVAAAIKLVLPVYVPEVGARQALKGHPIAATPGFWLGAAWLGASTLWAPVIAPHGLDRLRSGTMGVGDTLPAWWHRCRWWPGGRCGSNGAPRARRCPPAAVLSPEARSAG